MRGGGKLNTVMMSTAISLSFILPWIGTVFLMPVIEKNGLYKTVQAVFTMRAAVASVSLTLYYVFPSSSSFALFLLVNRIATECESTRGVRVSVDMWCACWVAIHCIACFLHLFAHLRS